MTHTIANLFSWSFLIGVVLGFCLDRLTALLRVCWLERNRPLPEGRHRSRWRAAFGVDTRMVAASLGLVVVAWSIFQTQANTNEAARINHDAKEFAAAVQRCQSDLIAANIGSRAVTTDNDRLSRDERAALAEGQRLVFELVGKLFNPPPEVAALGPADPVRQRYNADLAVAYIVRAAEINRRVEAIHVEQATNDQSRPPLPDPDCGK